MPKQGYFSAVMSETYFVMPNKFKCEVPTGHAILVVKGYKVIVIR